MYKVPGLIRFQIISEGRHRCTIRTGHEDAEEIFIGLTTFETLTAGKVVWHNRTFFTIRKGAGRRAVPVSLPAVTFPAFHLLVEFLAARDALCRGGRLGRNR